MRFYREHLKPGEAELVDERVLPDAFDTGNEYAVVSVIRGIAMLATPTCDLDPEDDEGRWAVWPLRPLEGSGLDEGNLVAGKFANLMLLPGHEHFERCFVDLTDVRAIRPQHFPKNDRIASVTREGSNAVLENFHSAMGRLWGYDEGEIVDPLGIHETGNYRCARCCQYDIPVKDVQVTPGNPAPECPNCKRLKRPAQWFPLTKHRR